MAHRTVDLILVLCLLVINFSYGQDSVNNSVTDGNILTNFGSVVVDTEKANVDGADVTLTNGFHEADVKEVDNTVEEDVSTVKHTEYQTPRENVTENNTDSKEKIHENDIAPTEQTEEIVEKHDKTEDDSGGQGMEDISKSGKGSNKKGKKTKPKSKKPKKTKLNKRKRFNVDEYLIRYGYLPPDVGIHTGSDPSYSEYHRTNAIKTFQKFAHLTETGELDKATLSMMRKPRCGFPDVVTEKIDPDVPLQYNAAQKWQKKVVRWKIASYSDKMTKEEQRQVVFNSFKRWNMTSDLSIEETNETADINIEFVSGDHGDGIRNAFDGKGGVLAHAFLPNDGRAHFDNDEPWVIHKKKGPEFEMVATHEFGHSLGLSHSFVRGSIMSPFYQKYRKKFRLHPDDIAGMVSLYGASKVEPVKVAEPEEKTGALDASSLCNATFDAIIKGSDGFLTLFVGTKLYKLREECEPGTSCIVEGYPKPIRRVFKRAPIKNIDAAAYIPDARKRTYIFKGRKMWRYTGYKLDKGYPKRMTKKAMPMRPSAAYAHKNQFAEYQLYMFGGKLFWEMNPYLDAMAHSKMKTNDYWDYVPTKPDTILQTSDDFIYVFKGNKYRKYDYRRDPLPQKLKPIGPAWIGGECGYAKK